MGWTRVAANSGMGLEAQWIFRPKAAPLVSLKEDEDKLWQASLLHQSGISTARLIVGRVSLTEAKQACEVELRRMGWKW